MNTNTTYYLIVVYFSSTNIAAYWLGHDYEYGCVSTNTVTATSFDCYVYGRGTDMNTATVASFDCCVYGGGTNMNTSTVASFAMVQIWIRLQLHLIVVYMAVAWIWLRPRRHQLIVVYTAAAQIQIQLWWHQLIVVYVLPPIIWLLYDLLSKYGRGTNANMTVSFDCCCVCHSKPFPQLFDCCVCFCLPIRPRHEY